MEYQISKKSCEMLTRSNFLHESQLLKSCCCRIHSWILLMENHLRIRKKFIWSINHWYIKEKSLPTSTANNSTSVGVFIFLICDIFGQTIHPVKKVRFVKARLMFSAYRHYFSCQNWLWILQKLQEIGGNPKNVQNFVQKLIYCANIEIKPG